MKPKIIFVFVVLSQIIFCTTQAQITLSKESVTLQADTMEVREAFKLLNYMIPKSQMVTLKVVKDGKEYTQYRYVINRMFKRWAFVQVNGKTKFVRI